MLLTSRSPWVPALLWVILLAAPLPGCETTAAAPAQSPLAGQWQLDRSASDNPDTVIAKAVDQAESRFRRRLAKYGIDGTGAGRGGPEGPADSAPDAPDYSLDTPGDRFGGPGLVGPDFRGLRARLRHALVPPTSLQLGIEEDSVSVTADQLPARQYPLGEKLSRIDEYGTAIITADFVRQAFVLKSSYTSHAQRIDTYSVDSASGALSVVEQITDPMVGRLVVHSLYRRG